MYVVATLRTGRTDWVLRAGHFAERHGLIIIVALGEVIVALGSLWWKGSVRNFV